MDKRTQANLKSLSKFANYIQLLEKVEKQFDKIFLTHRQQMQCGKACHSCCKPGIRINNIEKEYLRVFLLNNPSTLEEVRINKLKDPYQGERCEFLNKKGECSVYEARPTVCRSHGAPLWFKISSENWEEAQEDSEESTDVYGQDVCPLNFKEMSLESLSMDSFINIDTLNSILSMVNLLFEKEELLKQGARHELSLVGLGIKTESLNS